MKEEFYDGMNSQSQGEVNAAHEQSQDFNQGRPQEVAPIQENKSQEQNVYPQERMPGEEQYQRPHYEYQTSYEEQKRQQGQSFSYSNPNYNFEEEEEKKKKRLEKAKKRKGAAKKAMAMVACAAVLGCVAGGGFYGVNKLANAVFGEEEIVMPTTAESDVKEDKKVVTTTTSANTSTTVTDVTKVVQNAMPSVVSITSKSTQVQQSFWGQNFEYESEGSGSGIIVGQSDTELLIATNNHVVEGSDELTVYFINEKTAPAKIKGTDSDMDLAVIAVEVSQLDADTIGAISVATLGDSTALTVGEPAIAIGNALGYGQSVTTGVISALNRSVDGDSEEEGKTEKSEGFIQTDAAINPGNSGGALLNTQGQVIGINSMKISSGGYSEASIEGMGYAIPISAAKPIIDELMNKVTRDKVEENDMGYLGIRGATIGDEAHEYYNMPYGVYVSEVVEGSAAQRAGLQSGDIIVKFDGTKISSYEELQQQLQYYKAGETVKLEVERTDNGSYASQTLTITLGSRSEMEQEQ